ncbi:MAG TPA: hypothetical protein VMM12_00310 [Longimicrobiales bacterium]|nr:hypothetical protein [Longimicrobiales bacterium]
MIDRAAPLPLVLLATTLLAAHAAGLAAQDVPELRSHRHMAIGNVAFLTGIRPALHGGYLLQSSLARSRTDVDEFGVPTVHPPRWYAHVLASGGWSFDTDGAGTGGLSGLGQLGVVRRLTSDGPLTLGRVGLAAQGSLAPEGYGVVTRWGLLYGNAAVSIGWMRFPDAGGDRVVVSADLLRCILQDLGLVRGCVVR